jgi:hypothetical protein
MMNLSKLCAMIRLTSFFTIMLEVWMLKTMLLQKLGSKTTQDYVVMLPVCPSIFHNVSGAVWSFHVPLNGVRSRR